MIVENFKEWFRVHERRFKLAFSSIDFETNSQESNPAANLVLLDSKVLVQIIVWERGFCDLEMISAETAEALLYEHREVTNLHELNSVLDLFLEFIEKRDSK